MSIGPTIQVRSLARAIDELHRNGIDTNGLLARCGLTRECISDPDARVSFASFAAFYELAAEETGLRDFGLRVGAKTHLGAFDVLGYAALSCGTVREAVELLTRYFRVIEDGASVALWSESGEARLAYHVELSTD